MKIREQAFPQVLYWVPISGKSTLSFRNVSYLGYLFIICLICCSCMIILFTPWFWLQLNLFVRRCEAVVKMWKA